VIDSYSMTSCTMTYGPDIPGEVLQRRQKRIQQAASALEVVQAGPQLSEEADSSDDDDFGPSLTGNPNISETEALNRLEERSRSKTWVNMDPAHNPNRDGWMQNVPAELSGTFSSESAQDRAKEMMGFKK
jgi:hypothetical protein